MLVGVDQVRKMLRGREHLVMKWMIAVGKKVSGYVERRGFV